MNNPKKAVALISGGLDSMLAAKLIIDQGIHVEGLNFYTGFCVEGHTHAIRQHDKSKKKRNNALWSAEQLGIKLHIIDVVEEYKNTVINPKYGYGANLNPCLDCKIFMVSRAKEWMEENGFDFIITGEVVGQRPKSQLLKYMPVVAKDSGANDILLRPLCAKSFPPTLPEREGWVDREKLCALKGRDRNPQFEMAEKMGIKDYAQPAGGCCFLTDKSYSSKLQDMWKHRGEKKYELDDILLLKVGRHIRPKQNFKMIIGREEGENNYLEGYKKQFTHLTPLSHEGSLTLIEGNFEEGDEELAAKIAARFTQGRDAEKVCFQVNYLNGTIKVINVKPRLASEIKQEWYV